MDDSVRAEWRLPVDKDAPGTARRLVGEAVGQILPDDRVDALVLLVTEVITNAVLHGSPEPDGQIGLRLERDARTIRVVATDGGHHFKSSLGKRDEEREHFGLFLVDTLSDRWGVSVDGQKGVWFEIDF